jgi:pimeloyl-ACP methyl ester carboxylesterase
MNTTNWPAAGQPTIVFSHANGFPAGTYRQHVEAWRAAGWRVEAIDRLGHNERYRVSSNWPHLRDELIDFIEGLGTGPVALVGHSLGGFLSLIVACRRPALVNALVMLDAPVLAGWKAHSVHMAKVTGLMKRVSPSKIAVKRREAWASRAAMLEHFASKAAFARWAPGVLADYVDAGSRPDPQADPTTAPGGVRLAFDRAVEAHIYDTLPHHLGRLIGRHPPRCPVSFIAGTQSTEIRQVGLQATKRLIAESNLRHPDRPGQLLWLEGSHLYPMERPADTAAAVLDLLDAMKARG